MPDGSTMDPSSTFFVLYIVEVPANGDYSRSCIFPNRSCVLASVQSSAKRRPRDEAAM